MMTSTRSKKAGEEFNELETGYFVSKDEIGKYHDDEKVYRKDGSLRIHRKGSFIYRMAGRDREKIRLLLHTPEVLTRSLVKYALKELFKEQIDPITDPHAKADAILNLTVCEPAMGSAAFLNEAINQLAEALPVPQTAGGRSPYSSGSLHPGAATGEDVHCRQQRIRRGLNPVAVESWRKCRCG